MARRSPLLEIHQQGEAMLVPYAGPGQSGSGQSGSGQSGAGQSGPAGADPGAPPAVVAAFDPVEVEYAAIRRHTALFDQPHRATLVVTGEDRLSFLNRMLTQELSPAKGFAPFTARGSFWLSRKGRIDADLHVLHLPDRVLLDVDVHAAGRALSGLESYVITEDVRITDASDAHHRLALHGPASAALLARLSQPLDGVGVLDIQPGQISCVRIAAGGTGGETPVEVIVDRRDAAGVLGLELTVPVEHARRVYEALSTPWAARAGKPAAPQTDLARRIGWHALNIARIEGGTPVYYLDFGPDSLPHETGVLHERVSFKKGCYLGQEVVARMDALGHPKQRLVGLDIQSASPEAQPDTGTPLFPGPAPSTPGTPADAAPAQPVGVVTSSCASPMLGSRPIALAMMKWSHSTSGTSVHFAPVGAASGSSAGAITAAVRPTLKFLNA